MSHRTLIGEERILVEVAGFQHERPDILPHEVRPDICFNYPAVRDLCVFDIKYSILDKVIAQCISFPDEYYNKNCGRPFLQMMTPRKRMILRIHAE